MGFVSKLMLSGVTMCLLVITIRTQQDVFQFRKQRGRLKLSLTDDTKALSLLACSLFSVEGNWDGFAFCKGFSSSNCFRLTATEDSNATNINDLAQCGFYTDMRKEKRSSTSTTQTDLANGAAPSNTNSTTCINFTGGGCSCPNGATDSNCSTYVTDCDDYKDINGTGTGYVYIKPSSWSDRPFLVRCEDGMTMIQMRGGSTHDSVPFNRSWASYKKGFGNFSSSFWLGNDKIACITQQNLYRLNIDAEINGEVQTIVEYTIFKIFGEDYTLILLQTAHDENYDGFNPPDDDEKQVNGERFYTYDSDTNDCAVHAGAGWWYKNCVYGNLNKNSGPVWPIDGRLTALNSSYMFLKRHDQ